MASQKERIKETRRRRLNWIIVVLMVVAITALSLPTFEYFRTSDLQPDEPSPRTYRMDQDYRIEDVRRTRVAKQRARRDIRPQFLVQRQVKDSVLESLTTRLDEVREDSSEEVSAGERPSGEAEWERTREVAELIAESLLDRGILRDASVFDRLKDQQKALLVYNNAVESGGVTRREIDVSTLRNTLLGLDRVRPQARQILRSLYPEYEHTDFVAQVLDDVVRPTVTFNEEQFERAVERAEERVQTYYMSFKQGSVLLERGEIVKPEHVNILERINRERMHFQLTTGAASFGIVVVGLIFLYFYLREFNPELFSEHNKLALLAVLSVLFVGLAKVTELLQFNLPPHAEFALPIAAPVMLVTLMVSQGVAFLFSIFLALIIASYFSLSVELLGMLMLGAFTGIFAIRHVERRVTLLRSGLLIAFVHALMVLCLSTLRTGDPLTTEVGTRMLWGGINGVVIVPFTVLGLLPFLENGFGITTNFRLLELADLNHPLLRDLFQEAPGSFQHSVMLSNLCEQAARSIGANALLVRVGCLYHDLGKAENPEYFIENQEGIDNPHDDLKPTLSASILKAHVKKGSQVAREAGLPREIIDLIEQHHGTTLMKTFYHEALKESEDEISKEEFQYPGPLPQTREAGLCMLGDAVEAACRTLEDPTPQKIKERISNIVKDKFSEGQLNECDLTLRDLNTIISTFTRVLTSVYHRRIEYPDADSPEEMERKLEEIQSGGLTEE